MSTKQPKTERQAPRERLLAAAQQLFYEEGVNTVGIDKVLERAGVAKASLYSHFKGKDDLVRSYLAGRQEVRRARIESRLAPLTDPKVKLLALFDVLGDVIAESNFRGCAFLRASAEMRPDNEARQVCTDSRRWFRDLLVDLATQVGAAEPESLASLFVLLYDGATVAAQMDGDLNAARNARQVAALLIDQLGAGGGRS